MLVSGTPDRDKFGRIALRDCHTQVASSSKVSDQIPSRDVPYMIASMTLRLSTDRLCAGDNSRLDRVLHAEDCLAVGRAAVAMVAAAAVMLLLLSIGCIELFDSVTPPAALLALSG